MLPAPPLQFHLQDRDAEYGKTATFLR